MDTPPTSVLARLREEFPDSSGRRLRAWLVAGRVRVRSEIVREAHEGKLVEIDVERVPVGGVETVASTIARSSAGYPVHTERIEVWRYNPKDGPTPDNVEDYLVLENLSRAR
jgi:hypothetical protein